jgi:class 3 adenylate cyclase
MGRHAEAIADLETAVTTEPLRERRWAQLILALYRSGRQADALRAYRRLSDGLGDELGIGPSAELVALEQAVLLQQPELDWHDPRLQAGPGPDRTVRGPATVGLGLDHGPVTLLVAGIEDGEERWERDPTAARAAGERLRAVLVAAVTAGGGVVLPSDPGQVRAGFVSALDATMAAVGVRKGLLVDAGAGEVLPGCRLGFHTGMCEERFGDLVGPTVNRVDQLQMVAHDGQIVITGVTADLVADHLPTGVGLRDLGRHRLRDLERPEHVFQVDIDGLDNDFASLRSLDEPGVLHNLPVQSTSFVGRDKEVGEIADLLTVSRLVTCTGPGGVGKTRLALQAASGLLDGSGHGVWLVELAAIVDPDQVPAAVAEALGIREDPRRPLTGWTSSSTTPRRRRSCRSVGRSTAFRSPSSSRLLGSARCPSPISKAVSSTVSASSPVATGPPCPASRPSGP